MSHVNHRPQSLCLVPGCSARSDRPGRYALFRFPDPDTDPEGFLRWCQFCHWKPEEEALPRTAAVCANHFVPQDIISEGGL